MNYSNIVIDHFEQPRNVLGDCHAVSSHGLGGSKSSGRLMEFCLDLDSGVIQHAGFRAWGCPYTIAVASWLTEWLPGQHIEAVQSLDLDAIATELKLPAEKWHCVLTAEDALRAATRRGTE